MTAVKDIVDTLIADLGENPRLMINVLDIRTHDDYTFAHSVNVCSFAILVGISMGLNNLALREMGVGALMHDLGKTLIPQEVLNKPGKLTEEEYEMVKLHAFDGFNILKHQEIGLLSAHISLQHHERFDGTGYPRGLAGEDIHPYARIVAVADVYDAMVSDRIYRPRFLPHDAAQWLTAQSDRLFARDVVRAFLQRVVFYPVGTMVRLSNGVVGVVVDVNQPMTTRPVVRVLYDASNQEVGEAYEIDLVKHLEYSIIKVVTEEAGLT
jgi:HD-GYP domain-containing protein (c-di-GMP phosphodiesterase class II)